MKESDIQIGRRYRVRYRKAQRVCVVKDFYRFPSGRTQWWVRYPGDKRKHLIFSARDFLSSV